MCDCTNGFKRGYEMDLERAKRLQMRSYRGGSSHQVWNSEAGDKVTESFEDDYLGFFCDPDRLEEDGGLLVFRDGSSGDLYAVKSKEPVFDEDLGVFTSQSSRGIGSFRICRNAITGEYHAESA